jgi:ketosteroid isomerase-like protein
MSKTTEQIVTELAARDAIRELPQRYCDCVWRDDVEGIVNLYADNGVFTVIGSDREITNRGRAELLKTYKAGVELSPRPYIHNHVIELTGP